MIKREKKETDINLFSFDYHTDIHEPFLAYVCDGRRVDYDKMKSLVSSIDYNDDQSILAAIKKLKHDEHIRTAIRSGIIKHAFIIAQSNHMDVPLSNEEKKRLDNLWTPESIKEMISGTYTITSRASRTYPKSEVYIPDFWTDGNENCDLILEDAFLQIHFETLSRMCKYIKPNGTIQSDYILDIDLDYFTTPNSIKPKEYRLFSKLANNAVAITVAKESVCVDMCSESRNNADDLLKELLSLIDKILS